MSSVPGGLRQLEALLVPLPSLLPSLMVSKVPNAVSHLSHDETREAVVDMDLTYRQEAQGRHKHLLFRIGSQKDGALYGSVGNCLFA